MNLMERLEKLKKSFNIKRPLVAASYDPLVRIYSAFEKGALMTFADVVRDYVHDDVVMFSLFGISPEKSIKTMIHTLGHLGGLRHHEKPIDIMYIDPISEIDMDEYFCKRCDEHLKEKSLENL